MDVSNISIEKTNSRNKRKMEQFNENYDNSKRYKNDGCEDSLIQKSNSWSCSQCGKQFSSKSNLKVHLRVHTRVRPYHCKYCVYSSMHHSSIREHLAKIHPDCVHNASCPGYVYNASAVPDPEDFNSTNFNREAFIAEAKQNNDKLSADITSTLQHTPPTPQANSSISQKQNVYNLLDTPVSISPSSSNNDQVDTGKTLKRRRRKQKNYNDSSYLLNSSTVSHTESEVPSAVNQKNQSKSINPFSIDSIIGNSNCKKEQEACSTPSNHLINPVSFYTQWNAANWLYTNQMLFEIMSYASKAQIAKNT